MTDPYPVPRHAEQMVLEWSGELAERFGTTRGALNAMDFPTGRLRIDLMDGSHVEFKFAFAIVSERRRAIAVFTEHCGYHMFPSHEARVFWDGILVYEDPNKSPSP